MDDRSTEALARENAQLTGEVARLRAELDAQAPGRRKAMLMGLGGLGALGAVGAVAASTRDAEPAAAALPAPHNFGGSPFFVKFESPRLGTVPGESAGTRGRDGWSDGFALDFGFATPVDSSGRAQGVSRPQPLQFRRPTGRTTVILLDSTTRGELLTRVTFEFVQTSSIGTTVVNMRLTATRCTLTGVRTVMNEPGTDGGAIGFRDEIALVAAQYSLLHVPSGTEFNFSPPAG